NYENYIVIEKMAIRDFALHNIRYAAEARYGEFLGGRRNYLISKDNYLRERGHFHGMIRMRRIGQLFEFCVARLKTGDEEGKHHDRFEKVYRDINKELQGKLKYVQINILRHTDGPAANVPRIYSFQVTELNEVTVDQTPYIIDIDDVIEFDHKDKVIYVNGEERKDL